MGGNTTPAIPSPKAVRPKARPKRLTNQRETTAFCGSVVEKTTATGNTIMKSANNCQLVCTRLTPMHNSAMPKRPPPINQRAGYLSDNTPT